MFPSDWHARTPNDSAPDFHVNPFTEDVFSGALTAESTLPALYENEIGNLTETIVQAGKRHQEHPSRQGSTVLLTSPSAGAGKTHLLARLRSEHREVAHFFELDLSDSEELNWSVWFRRMLEGFHLSREPKSNLTTLTSRTASIIASGLEDLLTKSPRSDGPTLTDIRWLRQNSEELFQKSEKPHAAVSWFRRESGELLPQIAQHYARLLPSAPEQLETSLDFLYQYGLLASASSGDDGGQDVFLRTARLLQAEEKESMDRSKLQLFGQLLTLDVPLAPIIDEIDWIYRDQTSALHLARMIVDLKKLIPNSIALVCINRDTWQESFEKGLPEAMRDRLTSHACKLDGVPRKLWSPFLHARANTESDQGDEVRLLADKLSDAHRDTESLMPRKLLRAASQLWMPPITGEQAAPPVFTKPIPEVQVEAKAEAEVETQPVPSRTEPLAEPSRDGKANAIPWAAAMGDLRTLIKNRAQETPQEASASPSITLPSQPSGKDAAAQTDSPTKKIEITPELRSFMSQLRERALEKRRDFLGTPGPTPTPTSPPAPEDRQDTDPRAEADHGAPAIAEHAAPQTHSNGRPANRATPAALTPGKVNTRLRQIKLEFAKSPNSIDLTRFRRLIATAGQLFPAIAQEETGSPNDVAGELRWRFQQSEVNFGFRPYDDIPYWQRLNAATALRARNLRERDMTRVKLAVFGRQTDEETFAAWNTSAESAGNLQFCDVVFLTDHQLTAIYAIDQLLSEEVDAEHHAQVFGQISGELDFFWKMITRPVWTLVSQLNRSAH